MPNLLGPRLRGDDETAWSRRAELHSLQFTVILQKNLSKCDVTLS